MPQSIHDAPAGTLDFALRYDADVGIGGFRGEWRQTRNRDEAMSDAMLNIFMLGGIAVAIFILINAAAKRMAP